MNEFRLGWGALFAATIGTMCGIITITNYSQGFFVGPVTQEFGWTAAEFFLGFTVFMGMGLVTAPVVGSLAKKYGIRKLGMMGLVGHAIGYFVISLNPNSLMFWYFSWALFAVLAAGSLPIIWTSVLNGWFVKNRGKAIGITMAGTGLGAFLLPPIVEYLISAYDWRTAYRVIGLGALVISLPIVWGLFKEKEITADQSENAATTWGYTREEAIRTKKFWILGTVMFCTVIVIAGLMSNFARIYTSKGLEISTVAQIAAIIGITVVLGRLLVGILVDRFYAPIVASIIFLMPIIALWVLITTPLTFGTGVFIAICIGIAAGAELDLLAFLTSKYFGPSDYAKIFGLIFAFFTVGAGIAPPLYGMIAQKYGGYDTVLMLSIVLIVVSIACFLMLGKYPKEAVNEMDEFSK